MKKSLTVILSALMMLWLFGGCSSVDEPIFNDSSDLQYTIGMWIGVPNKIYEYDENTGMTIASSGKLISDEQFLKCYQDISDSGINLAFPGYGEESKAYNLRALNAAEEVGIKQLISDVNLKNYLLQAYDLYENDLATEEEIINNVKDMVKEYEGFTSLAGFMIQDEPSSLMYEQLGYAKKIMKIVLPDKMFYVNVFPVIGTATQFGGVNYNTYIEQYIEKINTPYLSYDHYPLKSDPSGTETELEETFLYNMDIVKRALGNEKEMWTFLQSIQYGPNHRGLNSREDASFQAYSFMAYGGVGIQWFCYWSPPSFDGATSFGVGMIDRDGTKGTAYDYVKTVNKEILNFDHIFLSFDWQGVMVNDVYGGEGNFEYIEDKTIKSHPILSDISSSDDLLVGVFKDDQDRDGFMVVNFTDPGKNITNNVELKINNFKNAIVIKNGEKTVSKINGGKLNFNMSSGDGYFVIPF